VLYLPFSFILTKLMVRDVCFLWMGCQYQNLEVMIYPPIPINKKGTWYKPHPFLIFIFEF